MLSKDHAAVVAAGALASKPKPATEDLASDQRALTAEAFTEALVRATQQSKHQKWRTVLLQSEQGQQDLVDALFLQNYADHQVSSMQGHNRDRALGLAGWVLDEFKIWTPKQRLLAYELLSPLGDSFTRCGDCAAAVRTELDSAFVPVEGFQLVGLVNTRDSDPRKNFWRDRLPNPQMRPHDKRGWTPDW